MTDEARRKETLGAAVLAGFTATACMWGAAYVARLPAVTAPPSVLFGLLIVFLAAGGFLAGRDTGRIFPGIAAGLVAAAVNLLILGSFLADVEDPATLAYRLPGFFLLGAVLGAIGAIAGSRVPRRREEPNRPGRLAVIAVAVTLLLVIAGGVVTTKGAGMDVPDWPQSFGSNMFLFPLSKMTGGIYYEHAHRLFGTLVGLTVLVLLVWLFATEKRRWVRDVGIATFLLVVAQGVLGGVRVTEVSIALAAIHGVIGQSIFALLVALAAFTSSAWRFESPPPASPRIAFDRKLGIATTVFLVVQIALGAVLRHYDALLHLHITVAVVVFALALLLGFRTWGLYADRGPIHRAGIALIVLVVVQVALGIAALVARALAEHAARGPVATLTITAHQATGALLLAATALLLVWTFRIPAGSKPEPETA